MGRKGKVGVFKEEIKRKSNVRVVDGKQVFTWEKQPEEQEVVYKPKVFTNMQLLRLLDNPPNTRDEVRDVYRFVVDKLYEHTFIEKCLDEETKELYHKVENVMCYNEQRLMKGMMSKVYSLKRDYRGESKELKERETRVGGKKYSGRHNKARAK